MSFAQQLLACRVLPVMTARDVDSTLGTARALVAGGMQAVEITLRTPAALECLQAVKRELPQLTIAAGTVTDASSAHAALDAGADFCISPGISQDMMSACAERGAPFLPGVATASEVLLGLSHGLDMFKLFPAVAVGGLDLIKSLGGPFPDVRFCPTGGLTADNFRDFLALPNVICCGGSWMVASSLVDNGRWDEIEALARASLA